MNTTTQKLKVIYQKKTAISLQANVKNSVNVTKQLKSKLNNDVRNSNVQLTA
jgi:hypothetical protein